MKYLSLFLAFYAVKCENVGNNYFVVKIPEDHLQQNMKVYKKPFQVYWNVPTMQCASKKIPFQNLYEKYGIIQNDNDRFIGNKIVTIYDEKDFPVVKKSKTTGTNILINGGVPQEGNLENHLIAFENDLNKKIPDPYFDGVAIIDFESWRPVFRQNFGALVPHNHLSIEIEKDLHNWWPKMWIEREAALRFEAAARRFMQTTLSMAKEKRPNALWGYYGFPYCFNMRGRDMAEKCANNIDKENDSIYWLWAESTALFPSLYSSVSLTSSQLSSLIKGRIKEASRVRGRDIPIFPYFWYRYRDAGFLTEKDLDVALTTLYESNASGIIIWGSSNDVNTVDKCNKLFKYVETVLGPKIAKYTKPIKKKIDHLENQEINLKEPSTDYDGFSYSQRTQSLNTDNMFSTETSTDYNQYTKTDESSQTLNNGDMSSTETTINYNDFTNSDTQTINHFDLSLSLLGSSTNSEYINIHLSLPTLNNNQISTTESPIAYDTHTIDENSQPSNNDDLLSFSSETSTYSEYTNSDQSSQTPNNDEISLAKMSTENYVDYKNNNNVISSSESSIFDYENDDYSTISSYNNKNSLVKISTFDNSDKDESSQTLNYDISNEEATIAYNEYSDTEENIQSLNKDNTISRSEGSTFDYENNNHTTNLNNDELSFTKLSSLHNSNSHESAQTLKYNMSDKENKFYNLNTNTDQSSQTPINYEISLAKISTKNDVDTKSNDNVISSSESSTFDYENDDYSTISSYNNKNFLVKMSTTNNSDRDESSQTLNYDISNEEATIAYNEYSDTKENIQSLNKDNTISRSEGSTFDYENNNHTTNLDNDEMSFTKLSSLYNSNRDESAQTLNYNMSDKEKNYYNEYYSNTEENVQALNNDNIISSSESSIIYDKNSDISTTTLNNDGISSTNTLPLYSKFINTDQNNKTSNNNVIFSKGSSSTSDDVTDQSTDNLNNVEYIISPDSDEISYTDQSINYDEIKTENKSTQNVKNNNMLLNSNEDQFDYLIKVDNSNMIETLKQSEYKDSENVDEDYLIIVRNFENKPNLKESTTDSKPETTYDTTQADNNHETVTKDKNFEKTINDLVVTYIDKKHEFKTNEVSTSTTVESFHDISILNSMDDKSDYLIKVDNSTNIETFNQSDHTNSTNNDNDYLVIVTDFDNNKYEVDNIIDSNLNLDSTTESEVDFVSKTKLYDLDPVVAYINKTIDKMKFKESISTEDESHNNIKLSNSEEDTFDYLIKLENFTNMRNDEETLKQYEYAESTSADNDFIILIKNLDD